MTGVQHTAWAKLHIDGRVLELSVHAGDVASVMQALLDEPVWTSKLSRCAGRALTIQDTQRILVLAFLHDLGKTNRGFWERQFREHPRVGHTSETAALLYTAGISHRPAPQRLFTAIERWRAYDLFFAAMAHHGCPLEVYADDELGRGARNQVKCSRYPAEYWSVKDGYDPLEQLGHLLDAAQARFPAAFSDGPPLPDTTALVSCFCGLLTLADWLGSDTTFFPIDSADAPALKAQRLDAAARAISARGLASTPTPSCDFAGAFGFPPRDLQLNADRRDLGSIVLLEAETGSGKTEAALWRWLALRAEGQVDGLYFALPTRSAAVQLHARVQTMLTRVFGAGTVEVVLAVPGYLRAGDAEGQALPGFEVLWPDDENDGDGRWAAESPKRFLAARVAVGTIDQVLMAGLKRRHAHFRAAVLSRSLLVVDEVHASDAFMGKLLRQVLANHQAFGGHALLLSATLTADARALLLGHLAAPSFAAACATAYPALCGNAGNAVFPIPAGIGGKSVRLETRAEIDDAAAIATIAIAAGAAGASVLVVRNSVAGAIAVAQAIEQAAPELAFRVGDVATLHHGRFAPTDRRVLDAAVEAAFGKNRDARGRILCGTQTLEQSLDIDADALITDLAPMDVLLQRIGRLHRHAGRDRGAFGQARAIILVPPERDLSAYLGRVRDRHGLGPQKEGRGVYPDLLVLEATLRLIERNPVITLPADNRRLVEGALHPDIHEELQHELGTAWLNHANAQQGIAYAERQLAERWSLDLSAPFGSLLFPGRDEIVATRLGLQDRLIDFDPPFAGPFGRAVPRLRVPGWMAGSLPADAHPVLLIKTGSKDTRFQLADRQFSYGRWGLESIAN